MGANERADAVVTLRPAREQSLLRRHPWIFSGAVADVEGSPASGETVEVRSARGEFLCRGAFSPHSQISVRAWSFDPADAIGPDFFRGRIRAAVESRCVLVDSETNSAYRLVQSESDGLPGLIVDRYGDYLVCQLLSAGAERWRSELVAAVSELVPCRGIYERSDVEVRGKEGLEPVCGVLAGEQPPELVEITEAGVRYLVDVRGGHKTGFYLDQRENRALAAQHGRGREVLNAFAYTGGFGIHALKCGAARITHVEASADALVLAGRNAEINGLDRSLIEDVEGDVFEVLRRFRDSRRSFGLVVLDPPKFVESRVQLERGCRGYKDINLLGIKLLQPGGFLVTFSCSGLVAPDLFQKIVADAALDAGREVQIVRRLGQAPDHPVATSFPEGAYLKGLVCRVR